MITDWVHASADAIPKLLGPGLVLLVMAIVSRWTNVKIAEKERERLFRGNRDE